MRASRPRRRKLLLFSLIILLLFSTILAAKVFNPTQPNSSIDLLSVAAASPDTTMAVEPSSIVDQTKTPGSTFTVNITIQDVEGGYGYQVHLTWNPAVLNLTSDVYDYQGKTVTVANITFGDFFANASKGTNKMRYVNYTAGWTEFGESMIGDAPEDRAGTSGSGWLATVEFTVVGTGATVLDIESGLHEEPFALTFFQDGYDNDLELVAVNGYFSNTAPQNQLTVNSDPISDIEFTVDDITHSTNWSDFLDEGSYTIEMPSTWTDGSDLYNFDQWEDDSTNPTRTVTLTADQTITAYYVYVPAAHTLTVNSDPISGVNFTVDGVSHSTSWSGSLS